MSNKKTKVIVAWASSEENLEEGILNVLDSFMGTRVYEKDNVDTRCLTKAEPSLPFFDNIREASDWMKSNINKQVQLEYNMAKSCGLV